MRVSEEKLHSSMKKQITTNLAQVLIDTKNIAEMNLFLEEFFNDSELTTFAKRLAVAYWLKKGRSYENIKRNLKVSSATIAEVRSSMEKPSLAKAVKKLEAEEWANVWAKKIQRFVGK